LNRFLNAALPSIRDLSMELDYIKIRIDKEVLCSEMLPYRQAEEADIRKGISSRTTFSSRYHRRDKSLPHKMTLRILVNNK
jgi:hypothetical protein